MSCNIEEFRAKHKIEPETEIILLNKYDYSERQEIISFTNKMNQEAIKAGFDTQNYPLFGQSLIQRQTLATTNRIQIHPKNIEAFDTFIKRVTMIDEFKEETLDERLSEIYDSSEQVEGQNGILPFGENQLFTPAVDNPLDPIDQGEPKTLLQWRANRVELLKELERKKQNYYKLKDIAKVKEINAVIGDVESQIKQIDVNDVNTIYESAVEEMDILTDFMLALKESPADAANALEINRLNERINDLETFFLAKDHKTGLVYKFDDFGDGEQTEFTFYRDFKEATNAQDEKNMALLEKKVNDVRLQYDKIQTNIIKGILANDTLVANLLATEDWKQEDLDKIDKMIDTWDVEIDMLSKRALGAFSGGGILGQLLLSLKNQQLTQERGHVQERVNRMMDSYKKILNIKIPGSNLDIATKLFQRDENNVRTSKLISKYTPAYFAKISHVQREISMFYSNMNSTTYSNMMTSEKDNFERINPMKLSAIANKYSSHAKHGQYFTYSEAEIAEYEKQMIDNIGATMFKIEVEKALELIDNYAITEETNSFTSPQQAHRQNPFLFIRHFESENFNKPDPATLAYMESKFTRYIPRADQEKFINEDFSALENGENGTDLMDFYKDAHSLITEYVNPTFKSEGVDVNIMSIVEYEDRIENEAVKQLGMFGNVTSTLMDTYRGVLDKYYNSTLMNVEERSKGSKTTMQISNVSYAKNEKRRMMEIYNRKSIADLQRIAKEEGLNVRSIDQEKSNPRAITKFKAQLANSLAQHQVNKSTSLNIFESINNAVQLSVDIRARRASVATLEAMQRYVKARPVSDEVSQSSSLHEIGDFLDVWGKANIYGYKFAKDYRRSGVGENAQLDLDSKIATIKFGFKAYNEAEKKLKQLLKDEKKNIQSSGEFNFTSENIKYITEKGSYFTVEGTEKTPVSKEHVEKMYEEYLEKQVRALGTKMSIGSFALGFMDNLIFKFLGVSIRGGYKNRLQGIIQTLSVASSERFAFDIVNYNKSRNFMRGTNTAKYFLPETFANTARGAQIQTAKKLFESLQIHQNKADEFALQTKSNAVKAKNALNEFIMDFSINNPEWKNQGEIALSVLQNIMVDTVNKDADGKTIQKPMFDGKNFIYKPNSLELLPEFDTPENQDMWVEFKPSSDNRRDSIVAMSKIKFAVQKTQGNYDNNDIIYQQTSVSGKLLTMFKRYAFENAALQYGTQKVDIRSGEFGIEGRKLILFRHAPTTAFYLMANRSLFFVKAATAVSVLGIGALGLTPIIIALGSLAVPLGVALYTGKLKTASLLKGKEYLIAADFAMEAAMRAINTPVALLSYGKVHPFQDKLKKVNNEEKATKLGLSEKERKQLSESAQELATKFSVYTGMSLVALLAKQLLLTMMPPEDEKTWLSELIKTEQIINALINDRNNLTNELDKYSNPDMFLNDVSTFTYYEAIKKTALYIPKELIPVMSGEKPADGDFAYKTMAFLVPVPIPNQTAKLVSNKRGMFTDDRIYGAGADFVDKKFLKAGVKGGDEDFKAMVTEKRAMLKIKAEGAIEKQVKREMPDASYGERSNAVEERLKDFMKQTHKEPGEPNENVYERVDWDGLMNEME